MMSDPWELGSIGLLRNGIWPAPVDGGGLARGRQDAARARDAGIVRGYYGQNYIDQLWTGGHTVVSQAFSGDIYQANVSGHPHLRLLMPTEGAMFWTDNMCIPVHAQNPKDAMAVMDFFYQPEVQAVIEYAINYVCPVTSAQQVLRAPDRLGRVDPERLSRPVIGQPPSGTAASPSTSFRLATAIKRGPGITTSSRTASRAGLLEQPVRADRRPCD